MSMCLGTKHAMIIHVCFQDSKVFIGTFNSSFDMRDMCHQSTINYPSIHHNMACKQNIQQRIFIMKTDSKP